MDHKQLYPPKGLPFLVSSNILTSFEFVRLYHSIRATGDPSFQRLQILARLHPTKYTENLLNEFEYLLSTVRLHFLNHCVMKHDEFITYY